MNRASAPNGLPRWLLKAARPAPSSATAVRQRRIGFLSLAGAVLAGAGLGACGGGDGGGTPAVVVDTVGGVEHVTYGAGPAGALGWSLGDTVAVIGEALGPEEYHFEAPGPSDLAGDPAGRVLVVDSRGARVLEYGPTGEHRATYGREGEGPGELRGPLALALGPGDTVWVGDWRNRRLTGFPRDGGDPRVVPYPRADVFPGAELAVLDGGFLQVMGTATRPDEADVGDPLVRLDPSLDPVDTLWTRPPTGVDRVELDLGDGRQIAIAMSQEFTPPFHWGALDDGRVVVADSADYVFRILGPDGVVRRLVERDPPAREATDADREAARRAVLDEAGPSVTIDGASPGDAFRRRMAEARADAMTFRDRIPRIVRLRVDPQDRIWVGVSEDSAGVVQRIDVYDAGGDLLGELRGVPFPDAFTGQDRVITTRTDELDVPQVVVVELRRPA